MLLCLNLEKGRNGNGGGGKRRVRWDLCEEVDTEDKREYDWVEKKKTDFRKEIVKSYRRALRRSKNDGDRALSLSLLCVCVVAISDYGVLFLSRALYR